MVFCILQAPSPQKWNRETMKSWKPPTNNTPSNSLDNRMADGSQLAAVVHLQEIMVDPIAYSLAHAPHEDKEITPELAAELESRSRLDGSAEGISHKEVLRHYGLKPR
jgi:hypothetical protein